MKLGSSSASSGGGYSYTYGSEANSAAMGMWQEQAAYNAREAEKAREWAEHMRATAYQTTVEDLKKAGLNPILAYGNGPSSYNTGVSASAGLASSHADSESQNWNSSKTEDNFFNLLQGVFGTLSSLIQENSLTSAIKALQAEKNPENVKSDFYKSMEKQNDDFKSDFAKIFKTNSFKKGTGAGRSKN